MLFGIITSIKRWSHQLYVLDNHYKTKYDGYLTDIKTRAFGDQVTYKAKDHTVVGGFDWRQDKVVNMGGSQAYEYVLFPSR